MAYTIIKDGAFAPRKGLRAFGHMRIKFRSPTVFFLFPFTLVLFNNFLDFIFIRLSKSPAQQFFTEL